MTVTRCEGIGKCGPFLNSHTLRITLFPESAMKRLPATSNTRPCGMLRLAFKAGPPSPLYCQPPSEAFPTTVVMMPVVTLTFRL